MKNLFQLESVEDRFPAFGPEGIHGSLIRLDEFTVEDLHFDLLGFDSGIVVANVSSVETGMLLDRNVIKYNTPISVARFIEPLGFENQEVFVVISSTIGPAAVWALMFDYEVIYWLNLE